MVFLTKILEEVCRKQGLSCKEFALKYVSYLFTCNKLDSLMFESFFNGVIIENTWMLLICKLQFKSENS